MKFTGEVDLCLFPWNPDHQRDLRPRFGSFANVSHRRLSKTQPY